MNKKIGRPPIETPKSERITVRLDSYQNTILEECAKKFETSKSDIISRGISLLELEKNNHEIMELFNSIEILFQIYKRKDKFNEAEYEQRISRQQNQIDYSYSEFIKSIK